MESLNNSSIFVHKKHSDNNWKFPWNSSIQSKPIISVTNQQFLSGVFGKDYTQAHVTVFKGDPSDIQTQKERAMAWAGGLWCQQYKLFQAQGNQYYTISVFSLADDGKARRRKSLFIQTHVIVVDDVGNGGSAKVNPNDPRLLPPSFKVMTSPGNEQWGYILETPETNQSYVENLLDGMVSAGLCSDGSDPGMKGVTRYVRLPEGSNNKAKYVEALGAAFQCHLTKWDPTLKYSIEALAATFGIDLHAVRKEVGGVSVDDEEHPGLKAYAKAYGVKSKLGSGRWDVTCPNVSQHTGGDDSGTAIWTYSDGRLGFKCHHGHCDKFSGGWLMEQLYEKDPDLSKDIFDYTGGFTVTGELMDPFKLPDEDESWFNNPGNVKQVFMDAMVYGELEIELAIKGIAKVSKFSVTSLRNYVKALEKSVAPTGDDIFPDGRNSETGAPKQTKPNIKALMSEARIELKINMMSHEIEAVGVTTASGNLEEAVISKVEDLAVKEEMPYGRIRNLVTQIAYDNIYHPFDDYLKGLPPWDGDDHIGALLDSLGYEDTSSDYATKSRMMIVRWLVSVVAAIRRPPKSNSLRIVLVFAGEQHIGKTTWFKLLIPDTSMFKEGGDLDPSCKDSVAQNTKYLITELGEIDTVFDRRSVSRLKAFLSKEFDEARLPYDRGTTKNPRKTVFCGTVNDEEYLVDRTGNTRFATIKVMTIDHAKYNAVDNNQLWAQVLDMFNSGERWTFNDAEIEVINERNAGHVDVSLTESMVHERFNWSESKETWKWKPITEIIESIWQLDTLARNSKARKEFVGELLKLTEVKKHPTLRTNIYLMPTTIGVVVTKLNDFEERLERERICNQSEQSNQ